MSGTAAVSLQPVGLHEAVGPAGKASSAKLSPRNDCLVFVPTEECDPKSAASAVHSEEHYRSGFLSEKRRLSA